jgi:4'-phosphopantetheinyl transferase
MDVWFFELDRPKSEIKELEALLSPEEAARAKRFRFIRDCNRYIVRHGMLRRLLAGYLDCGPIHIDILCSSHGKPFLAGNDADGLLQFSLSSSRNYAAFAFGRGCSIGVDIEEVREIPEMAGIVAQHFTPREKTAMHTSPADFRLNTFYRYWTRKEAVLKAQGEGLLLPLDSVDVSAEGEGFQPFKVRLKEKGPVEEFSVADLEGPQGFMAAVASVGPLEKISINWQSIQQVEKPKA